MDMYLRAVGFSHIDKRDFLSLTKNFSETPDKRHILGLDDDKVYVEYYKTYGKGIGLIGRGNIDIKDKVCIDNFEPYVYSDWNIQVKEYFVEYIDETPVIIFEDSEWESDLVFQLQNTISFKKDEQAFISYGVDGQKHKKLNVAGLSLYGTVILPISKDIMSEELQQEESKYYKNLIVNSKSGDEEAIELLTLYEQHSSDMIRERLKEEDFLSVVEGYFLPSEEDALSYSILGNIEAVDRVINSVTKEDIYKLTMSITGIKIQIFINEKDITGLPMEGMRFMGMCKLQGKVIIES